MQMVEQRVQYNITNKMSKLQCFYNQYSRSRLYAHTICSVFVVVVKRVMQ